jgi:hypothetical protein
MAQYWTAIQVLKQVAGELGLPAPQSVTGLDNVQSIQLLSLLNSAGNELMLYYPWEQFIKEWEFFTEVDKDTYDLPTDYNYFRDQTQWDRTNHWPLMGPKSAQEWAWLKGSLVAPLPRLRFRISDNQFKIYPTPTTTTSPSPNFKLAMEYIQTNWVSHLNEFGAQEDVDMIVADGDVLRYNPWLLVKFVKFKFYELKGFETAGVNGDFMRVFNNLTGKDTGAQKLSLAPIYTSPYVGPWSIPDGNWNVGA